VSFRDHVPYLRVLAPRKDVQGTVYLWAEGARLNNTACFWLFRMPVLYFIVGLKKETSYLYPNFNPSPNPTLILTLTPTLTLTQPLALALALALTLTLSLTLTPAQNA